MMNVRFSLLNMAQRILGVTLPRTTDFENLHLMGVLFKHVQYWLTKEIHRYPIKNQNMFIVYLNVCLHISI